MLFSNWCLLGDNDNLAWPASGFGQPRTIAKQTLNAVGHIRGFTLENVIVILFMYAYVIYAVLEQ